MGGEQSVNEETEKLAINHPKFKSIKYIREKDTVRAVINIDHEHDFYQWEENLNKVTDLDDDIILLPKAYTYEKKAICGSSGIIHVLLLIILD